MSEPGSADLPRRTWDKSSVRDVSEPGSEHSPPQQRQILRSRRRHSPGAELLSPQRHTTLQTRLTGATSGAFAAFGQALRARPKAGQVRDRGHFFAVAARAMRQVLMDAAREAMADKRGGRMAGVTLEGQDLAMPRRTERLLALDEALARLAEIDARQAQVVEYRFFAGLSVEEMAEVLGVSVAGGARNGAIDAAAPPSA